MNEIIQKFVDNNLQNNKNCNFFRLFKMKRKNQNNNNIKEENYPHYMLTTHLQKKKKIFFIKKIEKYI